MATAVKFKQSNLKRQPGELARLKVVQGPDFGSVYVLLGEQATVGRGEENDVVISDLKASRVHAAFVSAGAGGWVVRDKGSSNGILHNGKPTLEGRLKSGDTVTVGETTLEFLTAEARTMMLSAPPRSIDQIQSEQKIAKDNRKKVQSVGLGHLFKPIPSSAPAPGSSGSSSSAGRTRILLIAVVGIGAYLFLSGDDDAKKKLPVKKDAKVAGTEADSRNLATYLPSVEVNKATNTLFKDGLREYFSGNYSRARTQFETVLQIQPGHPLATLYLENCDNAVKAEVKSHLMNGKYSLEAGKLREARSHFTRVQKLLYKDQSNPSYIEATEQLVRVNKEIEEGAQSRWE